jgi:hypothetical protein
MNRFAIAVAAGLLALPALAGGPAPGRGQKTTVRTVHGKPQAPVSVTARISAGTATVTVRFHSSATEAAIDVHGVDGLTVTSAASPLAGARFARGEAVTFDVAFTEGPGRAYLAVGVSGKFGGTKRSTVASFAVGQPTPEQQKPAGTAATDSQGQRIKVMPGNER